MPNRVTVRTNRKVLLKQIMTSNKRSLALKIRKEIEPKIKKEQLKTVKDFETNPITREIKEGPASSGSSGVTGGYGNLFSFIGFESGSKPTFNISEILNRKIIYSVRSLSGDGSFKITYQIPSLEEVFKSTPIPWARGLSWAEGIEKGISNIGSYVYSNSGVTGSRSGSGIQIEKGFGTVFNTSPYMSRIIDELKERIKRI